MGGHTIKLKRLPLLLLTLVIPLGLLAITLETAAAASSDALPVLAPSLEPAAAVSYQAFTVTIPTPFPTPAITQPYMISFTNQFWDISLLGISISSAQTTMLLWAVQMTFAFVITIYSLKLAISAMISTAKPDDKGEGDG